LNERWLTVPLMMRLLSWLAMCRLVCSKLGVDITAFSLTGGFGGYLNLTLQRMSFNVVQALSFLTLNICSTGGQRWCHPEPLVDLPSGVVESQSMVVFRAT